MEREIKFRIWDNQTNRWLENGASLHCVSSWQLDPFTGELSDFVSSIEQPEFHSKSSNYDYYMEGGKIIKEPRFELSQFTGVRGAEGVEIYDGDILEISSTEITKIFGIPSYTAGEVRWLNDSWRVCQKVIGSTPLSDHVEYDPDNREHIKVIGNRYESN